MFETLVSIRIFIELLGLGIAGAILLFIWWVVHKNNKMSKEFAKEREEKENGSMSRFN